DRVVGQAGAEVIAPSAISGVAVRSRIHQILITKRKTLDAQQVRVTVRSTEGATERSDIHDQSVGAPTPAAAHDHVTARSEGTRAQVGWRSGSQVVESAEAARAQHPEELGRRSAGSPSKILAVEEDGPQGEHTAAIARAPAGQRQKPAAILVANRRDR